jgi:cytochrome c peroxidase
MGMSTGKWTGFAIGIPLAVVLAGGGGCAPLGGDDHDGFSASEWQAVLRMQPLATDMPVNPLNSRADDEAVARLGQMLFFENAWSDAITVDNVSGKKGEIGKVSCVSCHDPKGYFTETRIDPGSGSRVALSPGLGAPGRRNTPSILNLGWFSWCGWAAQFDSLVMHGAAAMGALTTRLAGAHYLYKHYREEYNAAFPTTPLDPALDPAAPDAARFPPAGNPKAATAPDGAWEMMAPGDQKIILQLLANLGRSWEAYPRRLTTHGSAFERYLLGEEQALSADARRGLRLFVGKAACNDCHTGPILSDGEVHNMGIPASNPAMPDLGRAAAIATTLRNQFNGAGEFSDDPEAGKKKLATMPPADDSRMVGAFRTPSLLNVAETGPYFHNGSARTLEEVVRYYNSGGYQSGFPGVKDPKVRPRLLTDDDVSDLVAFLKTLTGSPPDPDWTRDLAKH